jgi:hypothetical protein
MSDIREQAAKAASEWAETIPRATWTKITACEAGYILGYEAAKAELTEARNAEPRWRDHGNG